MPEGWVWFQLGDLLSDGPTNGYSGPVGQGGTKTLRLSATTTGEMILTAETTKELVETIPQGHACFLRPDDLLVQRANSLQYLGSAAVYRGPVNTYVYPDLMMRVRPCDALSIDYAWRWLNSNECRAYFRENATGTAGNMPKINGSTLVATPLPVPPLPEQRRIVSKLDELRGHSQRARDALDEVPALLDKLKQSVLAAAFRGDLTAEWRATNPDVEPATVLLERIRVERRRRWEEANPRKKYVEPEPVDTEGLPELPNGWCWTTLEQLVASVTYGYTESASSEPTWPKFLRITDLRDDGVSWDTVPHCRPPEDGRYELKSGDIVVARTGATTGKSYLLDDPPIGAVFASYLIRLASLDACPSLYLATFMKSPYYWEQITVVSQGSAQPGANATILGALVVPLCPPAEMLQLVNAATTILAPVRSFQMAATDALDDLTTLNHSLLAKAFRGELVPQDPNDEPASVLLARIQAEREGADAPTRRARKPRS